jgi:hypothetical protein
MWQDLRCCRTVVVYGRGGVGNGPDHSVPPGASQALEVSEHLEFNRHARRRPEAVQDSWSTVFDIVVEPDGPIYHRLVEVAFEECASFSVVTRPGMSFDPGAYDLLERLDEHLIERGAVERWPGTKLLNHTATLHRFAADAKALPEILRPARLYAWEAPQYPEDLAFYSDDGAVWLGSCAHEAFAFLNLELAVEEIGALVPGLYVRRTRRRAV